MRAVTCAAAMLCAAAFPALAQTAPSAAALKDLAPTGKLRAAINFGNPVLAQKGPNGEPRGITPDLAAATRQARSACRWSSCPSRPPARCSRRWPRRRVDIGFIAIEPVRAAEIDFTPPYVIIEGTYMVREGLAAEGRRRRRQARHPDRASGSASAYDLYLTRTLKNATLVRAKVGGGVGRHSGVPRRQARRCGRRAPAARRLRQGPSRHAGDDRRLPGDPAGDGHAERAAAGAARPMLAAFVEEMKATASSPTRSSAPGRRRRWRRRRSKFSSPCAAWRRRRRPSRAWGTP